MKRYIAVIEIDDDKEIVGSIDTTVSYTFCRNGTSTNYVRYERVEFKEESEGAKNKTYEDGLNDAWETARKIEVPTAEGGLSGKELAQIFKDGTLCNIFKNYSACEAVTRIKEYEEEQKKAAEIKIGDEVTDDKEWKGIVTWISPRDEYLVIILKDGTALHWDKKDFKKTGRHFPQIEEVIKQMKESN